MTKLDNKINWCIPVDPNGSKVNPFEFDEEGIFPTIRYKTSARWAVKNQDSGYMNPK